MLNRQIEDGLLDVLEKQGVGCIAFCPLAQGLLTDKYLKGIPKNSRAAKPSGFLKAEQVTKDVIQKVAALKKIAQQRGQSLAQMALAWVLRDARVTSALIGASRPEQIVENVKTLDNLQFTKKQLSQIDKILKS
jgi:L-glyceraldehyde 3-phosphate reductase